MPSDLSEDGDKEHRYRPRRLSISGTEPWIKDTQDHVQRSIDEIPSKFSNIVEAVEKIEASFDKGAKMVGDIAFARQFGDDLYAAYYQSSGLLTQTVGSELLLRAFRALAPIWWNIVSTDEYDEYRELPDELVLYRGGIGPSAELAKGLSWTLSKDVARIFMDAEDSIMIRTQVPKSELLAYFTDSRECIIDPAKLKSFELVDDVG